MKGQKLFSATFNKKREGHWCSSDDRAVYILASDIETAATKAAKEFRAWQIQNTDKNDFIISDIRQVTDSLI